MITLAPALASAVGAVADMAASALGQATRSSASPTAAGASFGEVLQKFASGAVDALKNGEAAAVAGVEGKVSVQKVVDTVMTAERELQTVIAVRDKAVNAYQEISRMAI